MSWYFVLRFLHIMAAMMLIGGVFGRQLVRAFANKTDDIRIFAALSHAAGRIETIMIIPGNLAVILFGVILAIITGAPIFGFLQGAARNWLLVSNILLILVMLLVPLVFVPRGKKFDLALQRALAEGQATAELRTALDDKLIKYAHLLESISMVVVVYLMVFKPF